MTKKSDVNVVGTGVVEVEAPTAMKTAIEKALRANPKAQETLDPTPELDALSKKALEVSGLGVMMGQFQSQIDEALKFNSIIEQWNLLNKLKEKSLEEVKRTEPARMIQGQIKVLSDQLDMVEAGETKKKALQSTYLAYLQAMTEPEVAACAKFKAENDVDGAYLWLRTKKS